ncbi:MAG: response regulator [Candidatus Binatia bacterium]
MSLVALVVDPDPADALRTSGILEGRGFLVEVAGDPPAALAAIARRRPDVILLDMQAGRGTGMEVLDHVKANLQQAAIPVVIVTGKASDEDILAGYRFGADYFLAKPYTPRQLLHGVGLVLGRDLGV